MAYVIAEIGVNHDGDIDKAFSLIDAAAKTGADAVKFQMFSAVNLEPRGKRRDMLEKLELRSGDFLQLKRYAEDHDMDFVVTPFGVMDARYCKEIGVGTIKVSSGSMRDEALLSTIAEENFEKLILSTGMCERHDIFNALRTLNWPKCTLLQCTSCYPTKPDDVHLNVMQWMKGVFGCPVGLSDHTEGIAIAIGAAALGAEVIEKHLTYSRKAKGPDHRSSIEPKQFAEMVKGIDAVDAALGSSIKRPLECENAVMKVRDEREAYRNSR